LSEVEDFLSQMLPRYVRALEEMHNGDPAAFEKLWSRRDPVTLLGAAGPAISGWENVINAQRLVASRFSNGTPVDVELISADVNGDQAYTVGYERSSVSVAGGPAQPAFLRATQIYRRENDDWRLVHRHADPAGSPATDALRDALAAGPTPRPL
jgi:ketosteroid isomerase-like protein